MRFVSAAMLLIFLALPGHAAKLAFIVGNADYRNLPDLQNTHFDARAYRDAFAGLDYRVTYLEDQGLDDIADGLDAFLAKIRPGDSIAFVYSGHGWSDGSTNYLVPVDAPERGSDRRLKRASLELQNGRDGILDEFEAASAGQIIAIVDACRNNPFVPPEGRKSAGLSRGLSRVAPVEGTFVVFSAGEGQEALDRHPDDPPDQKLSVFTRHFAPLLRDGVYLHEAVLEAREATIRVAASHGGHRQVPAYYDETRKRICLGGVCKVAAVPKQTPKQPPEQSQCDRLYKIASDADACYAYDAFASTCPDHSLLPLARSYLSHRCTVTEEVAIAPDLSKEAPGSPQTPVLREDSALAEKSAETERNAEKAIAAQREKAIRECDKAANPDPGAFILGEWKPKRLWPEDVNVTVALSSCRAATTLAADDGASWYHLGYALAVSKEYQQSNAALERAMALGHVGAITLRGEHYDWGFGPGGVNITEARNHFLRAAELGDVRAKWNLAQNASTGRATNKDQQAAIALMQEAAKGNLAEAQTTLGDYFRRGDGLTKDQPRARALYQKAAAQNFSRGLNNYGWMLLHGLGGDKDYPEALRALREAEKRGNVKAIYNIGVAYEHGRGVTKNVATAATYYRRALDKGDPSAMEILAWLHEMGQGVGRDAQRAGQLYYDSITHGGSWAINRKASEWDRATARALQAILKKGGHYSGAIDGQMGPGSRAAMESAQRAGP